MAPVLVFKHIKKDPLFLLKDYLKDFIFLTSLLYLCLSLGWEMEVNFHWYHLLIFLAAIPSGWVVASFLHNTGHQNISKGFLNRIVGEFVGHFVGYGFNNFIMVHTLHHLYSDHKYDPVSPRGMTFLTYLMSPNKYMIQYTKQFLEDTHRETAHYSSILLAQTIVFKINLILRLIIWCFLFGPTLFLSFYLPAVLSNIAILAHINYVCHRDLPDGSVEVFNLNHNLYYKITNAITFGGYYHKNHHENLSLFDPRKMKDKSKRLLTVQHGKNIPTTNLVPEGSLFSLKQYFNLDRVWEEKPNYNLN